MLDIIFILKVLWLCLVVYVFVKDIVLDYLTIKVFLATAEHRDKVEKIPSRLAMRTVNVVVALIILLTH